MNFFTREFDMEFVIVLQSVKDLYLHVCSSSLYSGIGYTSETDGTGNFETILILILFVALNRDQYWYWYHKNVPGLILILYLIRILPRPCKKCSGRWIDTDTDTETQEILGSRLILILAALVSVLSIRYWYSRLSLAHSNVQVNFTFKPASILWAT